MPRKQLRPERRDATEGPRPRSLRFAVVYQRPIGDRFHGGSTHAAGFIRRLSQYANISTVAPLKGAPARSTDASVSVPRSVSNIIRAVGRTLLFVAGEASRDRADRCDAVIIFDAYAGAIPLLWGRITRTPVAYYAQDWGGRVLEDLENSRTKGRAALRLFRLPLELSLLHGSDLIAAVSEFMRQDFVRLGIPPSRIVVCELPRDRSDPDRDLVVGWRDRLGLSNAISIVFLGNLGYPPNRAAAEYVRTHVVPVLLGAQQTWKIILVGPGTIGMGDPTGRLVGIGPVADLENLLYACHIGVAPMQVSGGISGKTVDYLTHGLRVVATPPATAGIEPCDSLTEVPIEALPERLRQLVDQDPPLALGMDRPIDPSVREHYLADSGVRAFFEAVQRIVEPPIFTRGPERP